MEWSEGGVIVQHIRYDFPVMVGGKKYFDYIDVELSTSETHQILCIGKCIRANMKKGTFTFFKENASIKDLANAAKFFLALQEYNSYSAGGLFVKLSNFKIDKNSQANMYAYIEMDLIIDNIGLDFSVVPFYGMDESVKKQLILLYQIVNHQKDTYFPNKFTHFDWSIGEKKYPLVVVKGNGKEKNEIYSFLFTSKYQTFCDTEDGQHFPVPTFAFPGYDVMKNLYSYDISALKEQMHRIEINKDTGEYINVGALKLITIYDSTGDIQLLNMAEELLESISNLYYGDYLVINKLQIRKRKGILNSNDKKILNNLAKNPDCRVAFGAQVLLGNKDMANEAYAQIDEKDREELLEMPVFTLYNKL